MIYVKKEPKDDRYQIIYCYENHEALKLVEEDPDFFSAVKYATYVFKTEHDEDYELIIIDSIRFFKETIYNTEVLHLINWLFENVGEPGSDWKFLEHYDYVKRNKGKKLPALLLCVKKSLESEIAHLRLKWS